MLAKIYQSVGQGGANVRDDVLLVQKLLNKQTIPGAVGRLKEDGIVGKNTISRIRLYQQHIVKMVTPDGRIDPNGKSFRLLSAAKVTSPVGAKSASKLSFGQKGIDLLKSIEDLALKPYDDQTGKDITQWVKGATIGYGHLISSGEWEKYKNGISEDSANSLFNTDLAPFVRSVQRRVTSELTQNEFDALVIFVFNIGDASFAGSSVLKYINDPSAKISYSSLEMAWKAWNKSQGKEMRGLNNRRQAEWDIYSKNIYKKW